MSPPRKKRPGRPAPAPKQAAKKAPVPPSRARAAGQARRELQTMLDRLGRSATSADDSAVRRLRKLLEDAIAEAPGGDGDEEHGWDPDTEDNWDDDDWDHPAWDPWASRRQWQRHEPTKPLPVEGGITARSKRGAIGETWWSRRFLAAVESVMEGGRSGRGRSYARKGQVVDLSLGAGLIEARVQGSRTTPYRVQLSLPVVPDRDWERIVAALGAEAGYAARLLAGDLPHEIEDVFAAEGASLFPSATARMTTECTCPDWSNPCKHVAAVCYLVAEAFDRDPFAVLAWRGRTREELLDRLRALRGVAAEPEPDVAAETAEPAPAPVAAAPLADCLAGFWAAGPELADVRMRPQASALPGAVLRHLTAGLLEVGGRDVAELLEPAYADLATAAAQRALATGEPPPRPPRRSPQSSGRRSAR